MSTATIYAHRYDAPNDEATGVIGGLEPGVPETWRFSIDVATSWERALEQTWIHDRDFVRAVYWLIDHDKLDGAVNLAAPHPLPNADFMRALREAWGIRVGLPAGMLEVGTWLLRSETELILKSRRVVPGRLAQKGFAFDFPTWPDAARDLCRRWRAFAG